MGSEQINPLIETILKISESWNEPRPPEVWQMYLILLLFML